MTGLEARKVEFTALPADAPADKPDMLPNAAAIHAQKIAKPTEARSPLLRRQYRA